MKKAKRKKFRRKGKFYVYILECCDGTYYTGFTPSIEKRLKLHNKGKGAKYTRDRRPVKLLWHKKYRYFKNAFLEEKRIKKLTRKQKEVLVNADNLGVRDSRKKSGKRGKRPFVNPAFRNRMK